MKFQKLLIMDQGTYDYIFVDLLESEGSFTFYHPKIKAKMIWS